MGRSWQGSSINDYFEVTNTLAAAAAAHVEPQKEDMRDDYPSAAWGAVISRVNCRPIVHGWITFVPAN